ncbi:Zinc finger C3HC4 type protein [Pseudoloma neurophilia]|uniref:Zinc finger C3HC4 type protein n=1 Tax=Pseudoloma neurophilia TaxID=146866 RepID=A0A0R0M6R1_9MICR|nr:Zinc finger C3HC4 type protein [Pseudoloma neurophilia]
MGKMLFYELEENSELECKTGTVQDYICGLCSNDYKNDDKIIILRCNHYFHENCFRMHRKNDYRCPSCRKFIFWVW